MAFNFDSIWWCYYVVSLSLGECQKYMQARELMRNKPQKSLFHSPVLEGSHPEATASFVEGERDFHPEDEGLQRLLERRDVVGQRDVLGLGVLAHRLEISGGLLDVFQKPGQ